MYMNVNCKHYDRLGYCNHPQKQHSYLWGLLKAHVGCTEYYDWREQCKLAERYSKPELPKGTGFIMQSAVQRSFRPCETCIERIKQLEKENVELRVKLETK